jgi:uncharacterized lipoprotein
MLNLSIKNDIVPAMGLLLALLIVIGASGCSTKAATAQPAAISESVTTAPKSTSTAASVQPQMGDRKSVV